MRTRNTVFLCAILLSGIWGKPASAQERMDLKAVLDRHAAFQKKTETAALQARRIEGEASLTMIVGGSGTLTGTAEMISAGGKRRLGMKFGHTSYDHERIFTNGDKIDVDLVNPNRRSDLGQFLLAQDQLFMEGLFGGVLSSAWPLAQPTEKINRVKYEGLKKIEGRELHVVRYKTEKKGGDVEIMLYFDSNTCSHVRSVYSISLRAGIGAGETQSARQHESRVRLEEEFDDFRNSDGYVVPAKWKIRITTEGQQSRIWEWQVKINSVKNNAAVDAAAIDAK